MAIEYAPYGDLKTNIDSGRHFSPRCIWRMLLQVSSVFMYMPQLNHRDIKPENIMLADSMDGTNVNFKLGDFGLATNNGDTTMMAGTPLYQPPEARYRRNSIMNRQADVFAIGLTVLNMVLEDTTMGVVNCQHVSRLRDCIWEQGTKLIPKYVATMTERYRAQHDQENKGRLDMLTRLLQYMTQPNPNDRITFEQLAPLLNEAASLLDGYWLCPVETVK